jgi:hypothetical protein
VARLSGTTSRTLRHYDAIGLLPPSHVGVNGHRCYGAAERDRADRLAGTVARTIEEREGGEEMSAGRMSEGLEAGPYREEAGERRAPAPWWRPSGGPRAGRRSGPSRPGGAGSTRWPGWRNTTAPGRPRTTRGSPAGSTGTTRGSRGT